MDFRSDKILPTILPLLISGILVRLFSWQANPNENWYKNLPKSPLDPPSWVFGIVWPILYLMMGMAHSKIINKTANGWWSLPSLIFLLQLLANVTWSGTFFGLQRPDLGFYHILIVLSLLLLTIWAFAKVDKSAALLLLPYLAWIVFATYLSGYIYNSIQTSQG